MGSMRGEAKICQAHRTNGQPCHNRAVIGYNVCKMHGAGTKEHPGGRPIVHGRYSKRVKITLRGKIEEFKNDPNLMALDQDIALLRVLQAQLVEKAQVNQKTGEATFKDPLQLSGLLDLTDRVLVGVEKWSRITHGEKFNVNIGCYEKFCDAVDKVIDEFVPEAQREAARASLSDKLGKIVLATTIGADAGGKS